MPLYVLFNVYRVSQLIKTKEVQLIDELSHNFA